MRAQRAILREIADRNLNPKVAYVAGKDGQLKEKKPLLDKLNLVSAVTAADEQVAAVEAPPEKLTPENETSSSVAEPIVESDTVVEDVKPKKKFPSKKKETLSTDE